MKIITDENIGLEVVEFLRMVGHDIVSVIEKLPGSDDTTILKKAYSQNRILITSDTDFGELVYHQKLLHKGVILLRLKNETNSNKIKVLSRLLKSHQYKLKNNFVVVSENKVRVRPSSN